MRTHQLLAPRLLPSHLLQQSLSTAALQTPHQLLLQTLSRGHLMQALQRPPATMPTNPWGPQPPSTQAVRQAVFQNQGLLTHQLLVSLLHLLGGVLPQARPPLADPHQSHCQGAETNGGSTRMPLLM